LLQPATEADLVPQSDSNQTHIESIQRQELVFVDTDTPDYQQLLDDLLNNQTDDRQFEVVLLDNEQSGIDQISETLASRGDLDAIHIISHGADGTIDLGNTQLEFDTLLQNSKQIANWGQALTADGDLLLYGCDLAATTDGQSLINALANLTGADVAASDDLTGNVETGGDWELEYQTGEVETQVAVSEIMQRQWQGTLAAPVANNDSYSVNEDETLVVNAFTENATVSDLLAAWQLDENTGTTTVDTSGNGNDGAISGATWTTSSRTGTALLFDGVDDFVNLGSDASIDNIFAGGGTVSAWIYPTGWGENGFGRILDKSTSTFADNGWDCNFMIPPLLVQLPVLSVLNMVSVVVAVCGRLMTRLLSIPGIISSLSTMTVTPQMIRRFMSMVSCRP